MNIIIVMNIYIYIYIYIYNYFKNDNILKVAEYHDNK